RAGTESITIIHSDIGSLYLAHLLQTGGYFVSCSMCGNHSIEKVVLYSTTTWCKLCSTRQVKYENEQLKGRLVLQGICFLGIANTEDIVYYCRTTFRRPPEKMCGS
ncbi:unnamed protein product, partial [Laminaria digitata]